MKHLLLSSLAVLLGAAAPIDGLVTLSSDHDFATLVARTTAAVEAGGLRLIARASASEAAAARGVTMPDDVVLIVFSNPHAVRIITANQDAGVEPPLHFHIMRRPDGRAALAYKKPSAIFRPYHNAAIDAAAAELDVIFAGVAEKAVAP